MIHSVIMPTYNRLQFLQRAAMSVLKQHCVNPYDLELLIIDDGSTDGTEEWVTNIDLEYKDHVRYIKLDHIGEPGIVRNHGLEASKGLFISYLDSDDIWLPHHLATAMQAFGHNPRAFMVSNYWALAQWEPTPAEIIMHLVQHPHSKEVCNTNCRVHKRECLNAGLFNEKRWGEDADFFKRIEAKFKCIKTGIVTSINGYIKGGNNLTYEFDKGVKAKYYA